MAHCVKSQRSGAVSATTVAVGTGARHGVLIPYDRTAEPSARSKGSECIMTVSIPLIAIVGLVVYLAWRYMGLKVWHVIVCLILGYLIAATTAGPEIHKILIDIIQRLTTSSPRPGR